MTTEFAVNDVCCAALELSKSMWFCAFAPPESGRASVHRMRAGDVDPPDQRFGGRACASDAGQVSFARYRALLRDWLRRVLACAIANCPRYLHDRVRPGELSQATSRSGSQDRSA